MKLKKYLAIAGLCLLCACTEGGQTESSAQVSASASEEVTPSEGQESGEKPSESEENQSAQASSESTEPVVTPDIKKVELENNGGDFVSVDGKVYYREYGPYSVLGDALYGEFLGGMNYGGATIKCIEPGKAEPTIVVENDSTFGPLFYYDGCFYSQMQENFENDVVCRIELEGENAGNEEILYDGTLLGGSADGRYLAFAEIKDGKSVLRMLDGGVAGKTEYCPLTGYFNYVGSYEDKVFFLLFSDAEEDVYLMQYDYEGRLVNLALMPKDEMGYASYPEVYNLKCENGTLKFTWEFYEGTGHFLDNAYQVSVPICQDPQNMDTTLPAYEATSEKIEVWKDGQDGIYSDAYLKAHYKDLELVNFENDLTKWAKGTSGVAVIPQTVERVNGDIYVILARAHRYAMGDIGWRESYTLMDLEYCRYENGKGDPKSVAKISLEEGPVMAYLWIIGSAGAETGKAVYRQTAFTGPEDFEPEMDELLFGAEFADNMVYLYPEEDIYGDWTRGTLADLYANARKYKTGYLKTEPKESGYIGYEIPSSLKTNNALAVHLGFDEEGKISYVRPVVMD